MGPQVILDPARRLAVDEDGEEVGDARGGGVLGDDGVEDLVDDDGIGAVAEAGVEILADGAEGGGVHGEVPFLLFT